MDSVLSVLDLAFGIIVEHWTELLQVQPRFRDSKNLYFWNALGGTAAVFICSDASVTYVAPFVSNERIGKS